MTEKVARYCIIGNNFQINEVLKNVTAQTRLSFLLYKTCDFSDIPTQG